MYGAWPGRSTGHGTGHLLPGHSKSQGQAHVCLPHPHPCLPSRPTQGWSVVMLPQMLSYKTFWHRQLNFRGILSSGLGFSRTLKRSGREEEGMQQSQKLCWGLFVLTEWEPRPTV